LVLHIAIVLHYLGLNSQNEGGGASNAGNQIKVALTFFHETYKLLSPTGINLTALENVFTLQTTTQLPTAT